jgi:hypothetical protein
MYLFECPAAQIEGWRGDKQVTDDCYEKAGAFVPWQLRAILEAEG